MAGPTAASGLVVAILGLTLQAGAVLDPHGPGGAGASDIL